MKFSKDFQQQQKKKEFWGRAFLPRHFFAVDVAPAPDLLQGKIGLGNSHRLFSSLEIRTVEKKKKWKLVCIQGPQEKNVGSSFGPTLYPMSTGIVQRVWRIVRALF